MTTMTEDDRRVVEGIIARVHSPGGYAAFESQIRAVRGCRRPVRLSGRITASSGDGHQQLRFNTRSLPDGVLLKACGSRRETLCPPCASLYRGVGYLLAEGTVPRRMRCFVLEDGPLFDLAIRAELLRRTDP